MNKNDFFAKINESVATLNERGVKVSAKFEKLVRRVNGDFRSIEILGESETQLIALNKSIKYLLAELNTLEGKESQENPVVTTESDVMSDVKLMAIAKAKATKILEMNQENDRHARNVAKIQESLDNQDKKIDAEYRTKFAEFVQTQLDAQMNI